MSARPDTDAVVLPEDVGGTGSVLIPEVQGDDGRAVCFVETAVDFHTGSMDDFLIEQACQSRFFFVQNLDALRKYPLHACPEAREAGNIQRPRFQRCGHLRGVCFIETVDAAAAHHKGGHGQPGADIQPAGPLRTQQRLVSGEAENIHPQRLHVDGPCARSLGRVHDKRKTVLFRKSGDERKVRKIARDVGSVRHHDKTGIGAEKFFELLIPQPPGVVHLHKTHFCPLLPQAIERPQHRVVLADRRDNMVAGADEAAERCVERLGHVGRESNAVRAFRMEKCCKCLTGMVDDPGRVKGRLMRPAARIARMFQRIQHGLPHAGRLLQGGGGVVEVDHGLTTFPAFSIFSAMTYIFVTPPTASFSVRP